MTLVNNLFAFSCDVSRGALLCRLRGRLKRLAVAPWRYRRSSYRSLSVPHYPVDANTSCAWRSSKASKSFSTSSSSKSSKESKGENGAEAPTSDPPEDIPEESENGSVEAEVEVEVEKVEKEESVVKKRSTTSSGDRVRFRTDIDAYVEVVTPALASWETKDIGNVIAHGGRPFGYERSDLRRTHDNRAPLDRVPPDLQLHRNNAADAVLAEASAEAIAADIYDQCPSYQRLKRLKQNVTNYQRRNMEIHEKVRRMEDEERIRARKIDDLKRENERLLRENAELMENTLENRFLEADIDHLKQMVAKLSTAVAREEAEHLEAVRKCERLRSLRQRLVSDCRGYELTAAANAFKVNKLRQRHVFVHARRHEQRERILMTDQLQALEGSFRVFVRVRFSGNDQQTNDEAEGASEDPTKAVLDGGEGLSELQHLHVPCLDRIGLSVGVSAPGRGRVGDELRLFSVNRVMGPRLGQQQVFEMCRHIVDGWHDGRDACLIVYGASGTGKTFSVAGEGEGPRRGFLVRAVEEMMRRADASSSVVETNLSATFLEIHAERLRCLLTGSRVRLGERSNKVVLRGHKEASFHDPGTFIDLLAEAGSRRRQQLEGMGSPNEWIRSLAHMVVLVKYHAKHVYTGEQWESILAVCDLCGFKRFGRKTRLRSRFSHGHDRSTSGLRIPVGRPAGMHGNGRALIALGEVISSIREGNAVIPYRHSVLTHLLKPCLNGGALCTALLTLEDTAEHEPYNQHTLEFGQLLMNTGLGKSTDESKELAGTQFVYSP